MLVACDIMNIFLLGAEIQLPIEIELKIVDQIHHLKIG
jgi:hypothetical protein